jgi:hypothetical protein
MRLLVAYTRERLVIPSVASAVVLVVVAAQIVRSAGPQLFWFDVTRAVLLIVSFRIWDDLMDRARDRDRHPERIALRADATPPLLAGAVVLWTGAAVITAIVDETAATAPLLIFTIALGIWYSMRSPGSFFNSGLVLAKYAVFVAVIVGGHFAFTPRGLLAAAAVFALASAYEWAHDGGLR